MRLQWQYGAWNVQFELQGPHSGDDKGLGRSGLLPLIDQKEVTDVSEELKPFILRVKQLLFHSEQHGRLSTAVLCRGLQKNGMVGAWHGTCESDTAALCKSNGKDTF